MVGRDVGVGEGVREFGRKIERERKIKRERDR